MKSRYIKEVNNHLKIAYVEDAESFNDREIKKMRKEGWKIQLRIPAG